MAKDEVSHTTLPYVGEEMRFRNSTELLSFVVGCMFILVSGPFVAVVIVLSVLWEAVDRGFRGGLVNSGQELTGLLMGKLVPWFDRITRSRNARWVKHEEDSYMVNSAVLYGVCIPFMFHVFGVLHMRNGGLSLLMVLAYHVLRIGPYFMNFAYLYTLCHKEGHASTGLWAAPYDKHGPVRFIFNWWAGLFYGVLPATFAFGHSVNHHKYNNGPNDVISTADKPRDSWVALVCFMPRFFLYASNFSTVLQFLRENQPKVAVRMVFGSLCYLAFGALIVYTYDVSFAIAYFAYPFLENVFLLACVSWSWHAFVNPENPPDEYVQSLTILGGSINVLNEDAHVVHHQYPGVHWSKNASMLQKHATVYGDRLGSVFWGTHTFEILALVLLADYEQLAEKFIGRVPEGIKLDMSREEKGAASKPSCAISKEDAALLLKARLRACWWGPRVETKPKSS